MSDDLDSQSTDRRGPAAPIAAPGAARPNRVAAVSRRRLLTAGALGGGALLLGAAGRRPATAEETPEHAANPVPEPTASWLLWQPAELIEPEVREAVDGVLSTTLRAAYHYHDIGGYRLICAPTRGAFPGRRCGCSRAICCASHLINDLPPNRDRSRASHDSRITSTRRICTRTACMSVQRGSPTTSSGRWSRGSATRSRSRSRRTNRGVPTGITPTIMAVPTSRSPAAWRGR